SHTHHRALPSFPTRRSSDLVVGEAEVQHAVALVDDEEAHLVQLDLVRTLQVQQAARRGDHEVGVLQARDLHLVRHAAHDVGDAQDRKSTRLNSSHSQISYAV